MADVCTLRLDFETFNILGPATTLEDGPDATTGGDACRDTFTATVPNGATIPTICGVNTGEHSEHTTMKWDI